MKRKSAQLDSLSNSASAAVVVDLPSLSGTKVGSNASTVAAGGGPGYEPLDSDVILPSVLPFKRSQLLDRYPKGHSRGRHWKHLKQIIQAENYQLYPADEPTYVSIEAPPSMYPAKKYCDITGFEAPYTDPRTKLRYANADIFKRIRSLPDEFIQGYLALRNAAVIIK
ncbi:hypothetical protein Mp_2g00470 [Marchantia polymorpha subsp. ruderalis]|uniref:Vps72/YL1 C-terminal domain-containing protein n=2 Tax=Marchantia polymorpha TaxID=3197 RepID=A0A176WLG8_MARPO|nr:hypothetical protein AXG93_3105s1330 [Marchantia polymorpha subsp. ruderalis]PTQ42796.1 hypothetical protein MARPO_0028s0104 [Marchantia polymorpha]BBN00601.1 hypothetical protein Mp_2g00470 [Marchantia polymorpha subsp. ruderalis]|eukprot:PTQ42796.1 hypothetical protein MARPO_0028s0104 [Marchantia polymorpha]